MDQLVRRRRGAGAWSRAWNRLADPAALSQSAAWWFAPVGFMGPLLIDPAQMGGSRVLWAYIAFSGQLVVLAGFWLGRRVLLRLTGRKRAFWTLAVVLIVVFVRGYLLYLLAGFAGLNTDGVLVYRTFGSVPIIGGALIISGQIACARIEHRAARAALHSHQKELSKVQCELNEQLANIDDDLRTVVQEALAPQVAKLEKALNDAAAGRSIIPFKELSNLVDNDVRPLIRELSEKNRETPETPVISELPGLPRVRLSLRMPIATGLRPELQGLLVAVLALNPVSRSMTGWKAIGACVLFGLLTTIFLEILRIGVRSRALPSQVVVLFATCAGGVATFMAIIVTKQVFGDFPGILRTAALVVGATAAFSIALYGAVEQHRLDAEADMAQAIGELQRSTSQLKRRAWIVRRRLSLLLHGTIQGVLHASALRLSSLHDPTAADIAEVKHAVMNAFALLNDVPGTDPEVEAVLTSIASTWEGTCQISWAVSPAAQECIDEDSELRECCVEIVREATHNAIVHGNSTVVFVRIVLEIDRIDITVRDNGKLTDGSPGTGTSMFDDMCRSWSLTASSSGTLLQVSLQA